MTFIHANDAAMGNLGYERHEGDFYPTPAKVTQAVIPFLIQHRHPNDIPVMLEPACGDGAMSRVLEQHYKVSSADIAPRGYGYPQDFFTSTVTWPMIVTNPPFSLSQEFVEHALHLTRRQLGLVAMLLRNEWDCAQSRQWLWQHPFARKVVLTWRPRWIPDSTGSPRHNYAWFIWDWAWSGEPIISYAGKP